MNGVDDRWASVSLREINASQYGEKFSEASKATCQERIVHLTPFNSCNNFLIPFLCNKENSLKMCKKEK